MSKVNNFFQIIDKKLDLEKIYKKVSALLTRLSWTNHLLIMSGNKSDEEREFYLRFAVKERYSSRQLERQMDGMVFAPVWQVLFKNEGRGEEYTSWAEFNAINGTLVDAIFR